MQHVTLYRNQCTDSLSVLLNAQTRQLSDEVLEHPMQTHQASKQASIQCLEYDMPYCWRFRLGFMPHDKLCLLQ